MNFQTQCTTVYGFNRACKLTTFSGADVTSSAKFILPEMKKLSTEVKSGSLAVDQLWYETFLTFKLWLLLKNYRVKICYNFDILYNTFVADTTNYRVNISCILFLKLVKNLQH